MTLRNAALIVLVLLAAFPAHAGNFVSGKGTAFPTTLSPDSAATVTINWTLQVDAPNDAIESPGADIIAGGNLTPEQTQLSGVSSSSTPISVVTFQETIVIPINIIQDAARSDGVIRFHRTFVTLLSQDSIPLFVKFHVGGGLGGAPRVQSIVLQFDDGSETKVVGSGEDAQAVAKLTLANVTRLRGVWEATVLQAQTPQDRIFQTIGTVDEFVQRRRNLVLSSPLLPTSIPGEHVIRLRLIEPPLDFDTPEITYVVGGARSGDLGGLKQVAVTSPAEGVRLTAGTPIRWIGVEGVAIWEIQFYRDAHSVDRPGSRPVAGARFRAQEHLVRLRAATLARLERGRTYYWRLVGLDSRGRIIAKSPLRRTRA